MVALLEAPALRFDFMNDFHDAANPIATVVSTVVLKPTRAVAFTFISPFLSFLFGCQLAVVVVWICRRASPHRVDGVFRPLQRLSAGLYSPGHGGNDAQKTIGIIGLLLIAADITHANDKMAPAWVIWGCYTAFGIGTLLVADTSSRPWGSAMPSSSR